MTKRQFSLMLGLVGTAGCVVYDDAALREPSDLGADVRHDGGDSMRDTGAEMARSDAAPIDAEASRDAEPEGGAVVDVLRDVAIVDDALDAPRPPDPADAADAARDASGSTPDAPALDAELDVVADTAIADIDARDGGNDGSIDALSDPPISTCSVDFTVSGVTWDEDGATENDGGVREVRIVGDIGPLGAWSPDAGRPMTEKAPGAWSTSFTLPDRVTVEFKFVKVRSGRAPVWEQWLPFDSNRSFLVDCGADGGPIWVDAATETGAGKRAVGRSYGGAFGIRPLDATK